MPDARPALPQLLNRPFITDGGIETELIFHRGFDLPHFAAFVLLATPDGRQALRGYYSQYLALARGQDVGAVLDTPTWRASSDWGTLAGYAEDELAEVNRRAVRLLDELRHEAPVVVISGCIGPRDDRNG